MTNLKNLKRTETCNRTKKETNKEKNSKKKLRNNGSNKKTRKKVKQSRYTPWRRLGERRYSSYSF
jgi:hypothetical protein